MVDKFEQISARPQQLDSLDMGVLSESAFFGLADDGERRVCGAQGHIWRLMSVLGGR